MVHKRASLGVQVAAALAAALLVAPPVTAASALEVERRAAAAPAPSAYSSLESARAAAGALEREAASAEDDDRERALALLEEAYAVRVHAGPKRQALRVIQKIERLHATTERLGVVSSSALARAADAYWRRRELILTGVDDTLDAGALRRHAVGYLARYGEDGWRDRELLAKLEIAERDWLRSCPRRGFLGLCVTWTSTAAPARAAANERLNQKSEEEIVAALRAQLRRSLAPVVQKQLEQRGRRFVPSSVFDRALAREVARALPKARVEALARLRSRKPAKTPRRCDELLGLPRERIVVHKRDEALAASARERFAELRELARRRFEGLPPDRRQALDAAFSKIELYSLDDEFEALLKERAFANLQFHVEEWRKDSGIPRWEKEYKAQVEAYNESRRRVGLFIERAMKLEKRYGAVVARKRDPAGVLLAASRTSAVALALAALMRGAMIPRALKREEHQYALCDDLVDQAAPLRKLARNGLTYCVDRATYFQFFTPASRWCEERLTRADPAHYPALLELFGTSRYY